jgi:hemerythrin HHE cation binding domain-containing protein
VAKKTTPRKKAKASSAKKTTAKKPAKKAKASKRVMPKRATTKAAKKKVAARSTASRKATPAKPRSTIASLGIIAKGMAATAVAALTKRISWAKDENDPLNLLETDHRRFEQLLKDGEDTTERAIKGRGEVLDTLTRELNVHEAIEEQILYPALRTQAEAHDIVLEGIEEHHVADAIIKELHEVRKDNEKWGAKFAVLKESVEHHIQEEERKMFPIARGTITREELLALGARMRALKSELEK